MSAPQAFPTHTIDTINSTGAQAIASECEMLRSRIRHLEAEPTSAPPYIPSSPGLNAFSALPSPALTSSRGSISEEEFFKLFVPFGPFSTTGSGSEPGVASGEAVHFVKEADGQEENSQAEISGHGGTHGGHPPGTLDHIAMGTDPRTEAS
ncbi:hypothetical protein LTR97_009448 [Elasticomyces elasticus]|uniref:Uncharacterized protein n=1 Tax=Elasticomyces elasticus TaxID=574655 RepID=A0AAN7W2K7_9PEZI|nr:hypothetical protein LTR97_009448 [Elasticomyces elasticus]